MNERAILLVGSHWAMEPASFNEYLAKLELIDLAKHAQAVADAQQAAQEPKPGPMPCAYEVNGGVALMEITGPITKRPHSLQAYFGGISSIQARMAIREMRQRSDVRAVMLRVESPGGEQSGTPELAAEIRQLSREKPTVAYCEDMAASAAYCLACQANTVLANEGAKVGSIGTYIVLADQSKAADKAGVKIHVVKAGEFKGLGVSGTAVTEAQIDEVQRVVNQLNELFIQDVAAGRRMDPEQVRKLADGRVHLGKAAGELGLIDGITSFENAWADLVGNKIGYLGRGRSAVQSGFSAQAGPEQESGMNGQQNTAPTGAQPANQPATLAELKAACPGASAEFLMRQLEDGATAARASQAWMQALTAQAQAADKRAADAEAKAKAAEEQKVQAEADAKAKLPGLAKPVPTSAKAAAQQAGVDPREEWKAAIKAKQLPYSKAVSAVVAEDPELHARYIAACNPGKEKLIADYFGGAKGN